MKITNWYIIILASFMICSCTEEDSEQTNEIDDIHTLDEFTFAIIGDYGTDGSGAKQVASMVKSWNPHFIITLGDNNYPVGSLSDTHNNIADYYGEYIYNPDAPDGYINSGSSARAKWNRFFPSIGNHDNNPEEGYDPYLAYFTLPGNEEYYDFVKGDIHFFVLNSDSMRKSNSELNTQKSWLQQNLNESKSAIKIVYFHHPPYSNSRHGNHPDMQLPYEEWGADIVFSGHEHSYERIEKAGNPNFHYIVNGLGGSKNFYGCNENPLDENIFDVFCYSDSHGAMRVSVSKTMAEFAFISINAEVDVIDSFVIKID